MPPDSRPGAGETDLPAPSPLPLRSTVQARCPRIERVADRLFEVEEAVLHVIERIVTPLGLRVDATSPWVDARLPDGSRVQTRFLCTPLCNYRRRR
jgi:type IV secretory pathway ATPase VirB11/archaellum biosynthesis ATPase